MIVAIHQPNYLPGLGFFHKMASADCFVLLDQVPYSKNNFTNRNRVACGDAWNWLTVPVVTAGRLGQKISEVETLDNSWESRHWKTLLQVYGQRPYFAHYAERLEAAYGRRRRNLAEFNCELIGFAAGLLGIGTEIVKSSELGIDGQSTELLLAICRELGASAYVSGQGGRKYLDVGQFADAGIPVVFQQFAHPCYPQGHAGFTAELSILDLLFNAGPGSCHVLGRQTVTAGADATV